MTDSHEHDWYDPDLWDYEPVPVTCNRCGRPHTCHEITPNITKQLRKLTP